MKSQSVKSDLEKVIQLISNSPHLERYEMVNLFQEIIIKYNSLNREDFLDNVAYSKFERVRNTFTKTDILNKELNWLKEHTDILFTSDNYFQTRATILTMLIPFND